jgi:hypothetical protein
VPAQLPVQKPAVAIGPVHHRRHGKAAVRVRHAVSMLVAPGADITSPAALHKQAGPRTWQHSPIGGFTRAALTCQMQAGAAQA